MSCGGILSPVMAIAGSGILSNAGIGISSNLTSAVGGFEGLGITSQFSDVVTNATGVLGTGTLESLRTLGAGVFPALTNAIPSDFASSLGSVANGGFTGLITSSATNIMGGGDLGKFAQVFSSAEGFISQSNGLLNSVLNTGNLATTFSSSLGGMDSLITGNFSQLSTAFGSLGADLGNIGNLVDLNNLSSLGDPSALLKQVSSAAGTIPGLNNVLTSAGVPTSVLSSVVSGGSISDSLQKTLYDGMTQVTGTNLDSVKSILNVNLPNVTNMAQLLDPKSILPNSYSTLTMPTPDGLKGIYNSAGSVNSNLEKVFQDPNAPAYTGDDPIIRARLGLPAVDSTGTLYT